MSQHINQAQTVLSLELFGTFFPNTPSLEIFLVFGKDENQGKVTLSNLSCR